MEEDSVVYSSHYHGNIIAFEGSRETITTQLRLLPNSSKILVIPPLQNFLKEDASSSPFDAASYILKVQEAANARADLARSFLEDSSSDNKRLVFMNGGTASAYATCISAISLNNADGDAAKAKVIFDELVRSGATKLKKRSRQDVSQGSLFTSFDDSAVEDENGSSDGLLEDPISRAMRAAEALDQETAALQPCTDIDLTISTRGRRLSLPLRRLDDDWEDDAAPFYIFGPMNEGERITPSHEFNTTPRILRKFENLDSPLLNPDTLRARAIIENRFLDQELDSASPACAEATCGKLSPRPNSSIDLISPRTGTFGSVPCTPTVVYGEAYLVDVRESSGHKIATQGHKRIKSVDRIYASGIRNQDIALCNLERPSSWTSLSSSPLRYYTSPTLESTLPPGFHSRFSTQGKRASFIKPKKTTIRRPPPTPLDLSKCISPQAKFLYVDRGTNPEPSYSDKGTETELCCSDSATDVGEEGFLSSDDDAKLYLTMGVRTILPMVEDLVIHFKEEFQDHFLDLAIRELRDGSYPLPLSKPGRKEEARERLRRNATKKTDTWLSDRTLQSPQHSKPDDEYDPFASHGNYLEPKSWPSPDPTTQVSAGEVMYHPPTPAQTPPPTNKEISHKFHEFVTTQCKTAVSVQNSLRSILNIYFSPEKAGYHQFSFPLLPELNSLWKPVFREMEDGTSKKENRKIDLIVAVGAQKGVPKEFVSSITSSLEKLGTKPNGITRSGKLDMRFLIASAMQCFTSQPLANQTQDNPFTNPLLLATLIIPHLETYMAAHCEIRFLLLEYPAEHLSTVLALQRLVGVDLLKVGGILNSETPEAKYVSRFHTPGRKTHTTNSSISGHSTSSSRATLVRSASTATKIMGPPPFSKANFLITSTATESEIATFISTIWKILVDISSFYVPDGAPRPSTSHRLVKRDSDESEPTTKSSPLINPTAEFAPLTSAAIMMGFHTPPMSPSNPKGEMGAPAQRERQPLTTSVPHDTFKIFPTIKHQAKPSLSGSIKSTKTTKTVSSQQQRKLHKLLGQDFEADRGFLSPAAAVAATVVSLRPDDTRGSYFDISDDEDSRFYADERKYMPLFFKKPEVRKGNSRKALKWLGLA